MKKIIKIISVLIVAIIISAIVYVKTNSNNDTVKMQNKEALGTMEMVDPCFLTLGGSCTVYIVWKGALRAWTRDFYWGGN